MPRATRARWESRWGASGSGNSASFLHHQRRAEATPPNPTAGALVLERFRDQLLRLLEFFARDGVWHPGIALQSNLRAQLRQHCRRFLDALPGYVRIGVAGGEECRLPSRLPGYSKAVPGGPMSPPVKAIRPP